MVDFLRRYLMLNHSHVRLPDLSQKVLFCPMCKGGSMSSSFWPPIELSSLILNSIMSKNRAWTSRHVSRFTRSIRQVLLPFLLDNEFMNPTSDLVVPGSKIPILLETVITDPPTVEATWKVSNPKSVMKALPVPVVLSKNPPPVRGCFTFWRLPTKHVKQSPRWNAWALHVHVHTHWTMTHCAPHRIVCAEKHR